MNKRNLLTILFGLCFSGIVLANDNYLTHATKLLDIDQDQALSYVKQNKSKFKSVKDKLALADWYYTYGRRSDALRVYEEVLKQDPQNIDALVSKYSIFDAKNPTGRAQTYLMLLPYMESAKAQHNVRYLNYVGVLALDAVDLENAYSLFDASIKESDASEAVLGMGLVLEKQNTNSAIEYYQAIVDNGLTSDNDKVLINSRLKYLKGQ